MKAGEFKEIFITGLIKVCGYSAIIFVGMIFIFLFKEGSPALNRIPVQNFLQLRWYPIEDYFGILPLIGGTFIVTIGAAIFSIPLGLASAVYIAEVTPRWAREILKPMVEILGGLPSVMLGFIGILIITPALQRSLNLPTGLSAFAGALILGGMAIPTIVTVAEDALDAVPKTYRDAALAMGATRWQTIWKVTLPAAKSGVLTAVMLGVGRAIGETMTVMMVTGNAAVFPSGLGSLFSPVRTMTATIAAEMGEVAGGSTHYHVLFFIGIVLFLISLTVNLLAASVVFRQRKRTERILS